jgi:hypothetical protein
LTYGQRFRNQTAPEKVKGPGWGLLLFMARYSRYVWALGNYHNIAIIGFVDYLPL